MSNLFVEAKYTQLKNERPNGFDIGDPTGEEGALFIENVHGYFKHYTNGTIYWSEFAGVFEVHGVIRGKYFESGGPAGSLGFPYSDETDIDNGHCKFNDFKNGAIHYYGNINQAFIIRNDFLALWKQQGMYSSFLGHLISDRLSIDETKSTYNRFENGVIFDTPLVSPRVITGPYIIISNLSGTTGNVRFYNPLSFTDGGSELENADLPLWVAADLIRMETDTTIFYKLSPGLNGATLTFNGSFRLPGPFGEAKNRLLIRQGEMGSFTRDPRVQLHNNSAKDVDVRIYDANEIPPKTILPGGAFSLAKASGTTRSSALFDIPDEVESVRIYYDGIMDDNNKKRGEASYFQPPEIFIRNSTGGDVTIRIYNETDTVLVFARQPGVIIPSQGARFPILLAPPLLGAVKVTVDGNGFGAVLMNPGDELALP